jgi:archaellum component FlaC
MNSPSFFQKRLQDLADNIAQDLNLLKEYEDELRDETDPRRKNRYRRQIERQKNSVSEYRQQYEELQQEVTGQPSAQMQEVGSQLQHMDAKLNALLSNQATISEDLNQIRQDLLSRYDARQRVLIEEIAQQLNRSQLVLTQHLLEALETDRVSESDMQQMLAVLEEQAPALPPSQASIINDPQLDAKHKLKVTLPIIPTLVGYEGELELGSGFNIKSAWEQLIAKLRRE